MDNDQTFFDSKPVILGGVEVRLKTDIENRHWHIKAKPTDKLTDLVGAVPAKEQATMIRDALTKHIEEQSPIAQQAAELQPGIEAQIKNFTPNPSDEPFLQQDASNFASQSILPLLQDKVVRSGQLAQKFMIPTIANSFGNHIASTIPTAIQTSFAKTDPESHASLQRALVQTSLMHLTPRDRMQAIFQESIDAVKVGLTLQEPEIMLRMPLSKLETLLQAAKLSPNQYQGIVAGVQEFKVR